jgi:hypothetical protein
VGEEQGRGRHIACENSGCGRPRQCGCGASYREAYGTRAICLGRNGIIAGERDKHRRDGMSQRGLKWVFQSDCDDTRHLTISLEGKQIFY